MIDKTNMTSISENLIFPIMCRSIVKDEVFENFLSPQVLGRL